MERLKRAGVLAADKLLRRFPESSSRSLGKILYEQNVEIFSTRDAAYVAVRRLRGAQGVKNRRGIEAAGNTDLIREKPTLLTIPDEQPGLDWDPVRIDGSLFLSFSDLHFPYHDKIAIQITVDDAKKLGVNSILINGDLLDSYQLSKFAKSPAKPNYAEEIKIGKAFLSYLRQEFPKALIHWKFGNHDLHLERFLWTKAPELFGCPGMDLEHFMDVESFGVNVIKGDARVMMGKLTALHGHEFGGGSIGPVNPARGAFLKLTESVIISHFHRSSQHSESTMHERLITCWSIGCQCRLHPEYARVNKWNQGYATIAVSDAGDFEVNNRRIYNGRSW